MHKKLLYIIILFFTVQSFLFGQTLTVKNGATFKMSKGSVLYINGGLNVETGAALTQGTAVADSCTLLLTGDFTIGGTLTQNSSSVWFVGGVDQNITGLTAMQHFIEDKFAGKLFLKNALTITRSICLVRGLLDIDIYNLTIDKNAYIYSNIDTSKYYTSFDSTHSVYCSKGYTGGSLIRKVNTAMPTFYFNFPISIPDTNGTSGNSIYAPALINFWDAASATFGPNPYISMTVHNKEHPKRIIAHTLLGQYWKIATNDITINPVPGVNLKFNYNQSQVQSTEDDYHSLYYTPSNPATGLWEVERGDATNTIDIATNVISITKSDYLQGDWTAGDLPAFYSIANGNWTAAASWSKRGYGGVAATTPPPDYAYTYIGNSKTITANSAITVNQRNTIDSSGTISFVDETIMTGTGEFRIKKYGGIEVGAIAGVTTSGATGNVQTTTRKYNYLEHDRSNFIFTNSTASAQAHGNGLPDTVNKFIVRRGDIARVVNLTKPVTVNKLMHIESGTLDANAHVYLEGNLRVGTVANGKLGYIKPNTYTFTFFGLTQDTIFHRVPISDSSSINFYNLVINKRLNTGNVVLAARTGIAIRNNLNFGSINQCQILARDTAAYVRIIGNGTTSATVTGAGPNKVYTSWGWIDGELHKYIKANGPNQFFEVGNYEYYTPFEIGSDNYKDFDQGYCSVKIMTSPSGMHPNLYDYYANLIDPQATSLRYWRVMQPYYSQFDYGSKVPDVTAWLANDKDKWNTGSFECMDMVIWDGRDIREGWLYCQPREYGFSSAFEGAGCDNIRNAKRPGFKYFATLAFNNNNMELEVSEAAEDFKFPTRKVVVEPDGDKLLFDYLFGNSNAIVSGSTYYSCKTGFWDDSTTWSTVSHLSTINNGTNLYSKKYPIRQYDRAFIGGNDTVKLRSSIGNGDFSIINSTNRYELKTGPNTIVESDGTLDCGTNVLYGLSFFVTPRGSLIIGATDGIINRDTLGIWPSRIAGNIRTVNRMFSDSINLIYKPKGHVAPKYTNVVNNYPYYDVYPQASMNTGNYYISRVQLSGTTLDNNTSNLLKNALNFTDFSATVQSGSTYNVILTNTGSSSTHRLQVWVDTSYNAVFETNELLINYDFAGTSVTRPLTIPANTLPGGTVMRIIYYNNYLNATDSAHIVAYPAGEAEDYWLNIEKPTTILTQYTGNGLPNIIHALTVQNIRTTADKVLLSKGTTVIDSLYIKSGKLDVNTYDLSIIRDFRSDLPNPLEPMTKSISFIDSPISKIRGNGNPAFHNLVVNKTLGADVDVMSNIEIKNQLDFKSNTIVDLFDNKRITLKEGGSITSPTAFSALKMIAVTGRKTGGTVKKEWNTTAGVLKETVIPIGVGTALNTAELSFNQTDAYPGIPSLIVQLFDSTHEKSTSPHTLGKFWKITSANLGNLTSRLFKFHYSTADTNGDATKYAAALYNYTSWVYDLGDVVQGFPSPITANSTSGNYDQVDGDWTAKFRKSLYFSRATGPWNIPANWTASKTHNGPAMLAFPTSTDDSVVIGTGSTGEHTITLVQDVTVSGLVLGTTVLNPGTLNTNGFAVFGNTFAMGQGSTLMVTSPNGISAIGQPDAALGNIRTTLRYYGDVASLANFVYSGTASQVTGSGLPTNINNLTVNNTGLIGDLATGLQGDRVVTIDKILSIGGNLTVTSGILNLQGFTVNCANALGTASIADNAAINIGGANNMLTAVNNYAVYSLTDLSYIEFSGDPQVISQYPVHFNPVLGFGNVNILNTGIKTVNLPMTVRTNLFNSQASTLNNNIGVNQLFVKKSLINRGIMTNEGNIQTCE